MNMIVNRCMYETNERKIFLQENNHQQLTCTLSFNSLSLSHFPLSLYKNTLIQHFSLLKPFGPLLSISISLEHFENILKMSTTAPMEIGSILEFIENKTILITGATGFLAKVFLEKILRVQPNVKKLYLLLRAADSKSAIQRFNNEIIAKDLFRVVKEKYGLKLNSMISEKITIVPGDISCEGLGIQDLNMRDEMLSQIDVVINLAANTNFDDRYDVLIGINTMGAKHVLNFAKKCLKLEVLVHVSTAYVCGETTGLIPETPHQMGKALNDVLGLDIQHEKKLIEETLKQLGDEGAAPETIKQAMKDLGMERAKMYGWPNTYVFTKAMGEMIVEEMKGNLPLAVIRPSIVTSTYKEPFPGWTEGIRTIDGVAVGYGRGRLTCFLGDPNAIADIIPADMVVNVMMVAMVVHANNQCDSKIYHVGSSHRHPVKYADFQEIGFNYFKEKPWLDKQGKEIKVSKMKMITSMTTFHSYMAFHYLLPLKGLEFANTLFCKNFQSTYSDLKRKINLVMRLVEMYRPYVFFGGVFDDTNTENLRVAVKAGGVETDTFYFDPKCINWTTYFVDTHIPGLAKYVLK